MEPENTQRTALTVPSPSPNPTRQQLASEKVIIQAPMSFTGSAKRLWRFTRLSDQPAIRVPLAALVLCVIPIAWAAILCWYVAFGILLVPYRILRRGDRKAKRQAAQHREMMDAMSRKGES